MEKNLEKLYLFNSMSRKKALFVPLHKGKVSIYVCGITVYDNCHIGHARVFIFFDVVVRFLRHLNYDVAYVRNITDIDDKIIKKALAKKTTCEAVTAKYIAAMHDDAAALGVIPPNFEPKATAYIDEIQAMIRQLIDEGLAYIKANGDVYYSVSSFDSYGSLARRNLLQLRAGCRVEVDDKKEDPLDFVLWKLAKPGEPAWSSPWGSGRPGWHIECSAMASSILGSTLDIHGGGVDLQFPHHENEIAQSEGANNKEFCRNWMHVGAVQVNSVKMSKSLGNFATIAEVLAKYHKDEVRYFMLMTHYRQPLQYNDDNLQAASKIINKLYNSLRAVGGDLSPCENNMEYNKFKDCLLDDFNTPQAFTVLAAQLKRLNIALTTDNKDKYKIAQSLLAMGLLIGLFSDGVAAYFAKNNELDVVMIENLMQERNAARACKDWQRSDELRLKLLEAGVTIKDSAAGATWKKT